MTVENSKAPDGKRGPAAFSGGGAFHAALRRIAAPQRVMPGFLLALLILLFAGWVSFQSIDDLIRASQWVTHSHLVIDRLQALMMEVRGAEAAEHGYVISGDEAHREAFLAAERRIPEHVAGLRLALRDNPQQIERLDAFEVHLAETMRFFREVTEATRKRGPEAGRRLFEEGRGDALAAQLRALALEMEQHERALLAARQLAADESAIQTRRNVTGAGVAALSLLLIAGIIVRRDSRERIRAAAEVAEANERLSATAAAAQQRTELITRLADLSQLLQACQEPVEAYRVLERALPGLVHRAGALFILAASQNVLELMAAWGSPAGKERVFGPHDCWALRRSRLHVSIPGGSAPICPHLAGSDQQSATCVPLMAQGDTLGVLVLMGAVTRSEETNQLITATSEQVALALANLRLRDTLKNQSIRDPLTGLFNRRFLQESLDRECRRALRSGRPLSVVIFDVDHFKRFNDTFGHDAGDLVLREIGALLRATFRGEDVACRYGGEEFALVLSDTSLEQAIARAQQLREQAHQIFVTHRRQAIGAITLSLGVASLPEHGTSGETLIAAADRALYAAKHAGRDRVEVARTDEDHVAAE